VFTNCIIYGNIPNDTFGIFEISYSVVQGGFLGEGNIDLAPLFVDTANSDYHLRADSPCIDSGTSEGASSADIEGTTRPKGAGYDMGAYEAYLPVSLTAYTPDPTNNDTPSLDWADVTGANTYTLQYSNQSDFSSKTEVTGLQESAYTIPSALPDGAWYWRVKAVDSAGTAGWWSWTDSFVVDTVSPTATISGTPDDPTNQTAASLTIGGEGVTHYKYKVDAEVYGSETEIQTPVALSGLSEGIHTVSVIGRDKAGNWQLEASPTTASWPVDTQAPTATISGTPISPTNQTGTTLTVSGEGVTHYKYKLNSGTYGDEIAVSAPISLFDFTNASHTIYVIGRDLAGNWQTEATTATWIVDTIPPTATISDVPPTPTNQTGATLTVGGESVIQYKYKLNDGAYGAETAVATPIGLTGLTDGSHTIYLIGRDAAGNWQSEASATTASWTVDTAAPTITGISDNAIPTSTKTWTWGASEAATFRFALDQAPTWTQTGEFGPSTTTTKSDGNGTWYLHVQAKDTAGNESSVTSVSAIFYAQPTVTTGAATSVASTSAILNGTVNPNGTETTYYFQYGTTTGFGSTTATANAGAGVSDVLAEASLTGLNPSTTYYYRFTATNNAGTGYGSDLSFRTTYPSTIYVNSNGGCGDKSPCHTNIQTAIDAAQNGFAILIAGGTYNGPFILDQPISLTLQGGWDSAFSDQTESTILKEAPKAKQGSLTMQELSIKP